MRKKVIFLLLTSVFVIIIAFGSLSSHVKVRAEYSGIKGKIDTILEVYPTGSYFTVASNTAGCTSSNHDTVDGNWCYGCYLPNIPARGGLPSGAAVKHEADTCCGFASYVFYCIFGHSYKVNTTAKKSGPVYGDLVSTGSHYFIYLSEDSSYYYVYDANGYNGGKNKVIYNNNYPKSAVTNLTVYHANNYDDVNGAVSIIKENVPTGEYYFVHTATGKYLDVSGGTDANNTNVQITGANNTATQQWIISGNLNSYKIKPRCTSSRVLNSYGTTVNIGNNVNIWDSVDDNTQRWFFEKVSGGYIIHNVENTNCVLDVKENNVFMNVYNINSKTQVWKLVKVGVEPTSAPTAAPTSKPTTAPTSKPTAAPTSKPTTAPTSAPTAGSATVPTNNPVSTAHTTSEATKTPADTPISTAIPTETTFGVLTNSPPDLAMATEEINETQTTNSSETIISETAENNEPASTDISGENGNNDSSQNVGQDKESENTGKPGKGISTEQIMIYVLLAAVASLGTLLVVSLVKRKK